jgi:hypothetical protein
MKGIPVPIVILLLCFFSGKAAADTALDTVSEAALETMSETPSQADVPVYEVSQKWMAVETALLNYVALGLPWQAKVSRR